MIPYTSMRKYRRDLLKEIGPVDKETKANVLYDIEEHLGLLVKDILIKNRKVSKGIAFHMAVESFGYPSEIAEAYRNFF